MRKSRTKGPEIILHESKFFGGTKRSEDIHDLESPSSFPTARSTVAPKTAARSADNSSKEREVINIDGDVSSRTKEKGKGKALMHTEHESSPETDNPGIISDDIFSGKERRHSEHEQQSRLPNIMTSLRNSAGPSSSKSNRVEDGSSTARLRKRLETSYQSDPIEDDDNELTMLAPSSRDGANKEKVKSRTIFSSSRNALTDNEESQLLEPEEPSSKRRKIQDDPLPGKARFPGNHGNNSGGTTRPPMLGQSKINTMRGQRAETSSLHGDSIPTGRVKRLVLSLNGNRPIKHLDLSAQRMKLKNGNKLNVRRSICFITLFDTWLLVNETL